MPAVAITDHGNLFGAIDFYQCAKAAGIKPISCARPTPLAAHTRKKPSRESNFHFTLLAENETGLSQFGKADFGGASGRFYYRPAHRQGLLASHADGLIGLSGCLAVRSTALLQSGNVEKAQNSDRGISRHFGPRNFFIELHDHGMAEQKPMQCASAKNSPANSGSVWSRPPTFTSSDAAITEHTMFFFVSTPLRKIEDEKRMRYDA